MLKWLQRLFIRETPPARSLEVNIWRNDGVIWVDVLVDGKLFNQDAFFVEFIRHVGDVNGHVVGRYSCVWHFTIHVSGARRILGVTAPISNSKEEHMHFCRVITEARIKFMEYTRGVAL